MRRGLIEGKMGIQGQSSGFFRAASSMAAGRTRPIRSGFISSIAFIAFLFGIFGTATAGAATIYVPGDYAFIQDAIDAAAAGDEIVVRPGTYFENIDFMGKAVTLRSEKGPALTKIDGSGAGDTVVFDDFEGSGSVLSGFTVTNGAAAGGQGGGIFCQDASPVISGNIIASNAGEGIFLGPYACPEIAGNTIRDNAGRGVFCGTFADALISGNTITGNAGGLSFDDSWALVTGNTITANAVAGDGGGIRAVFCEGIVIANNVIADNSASGKGGAILLSDGSSPDIVNNTIFGNIAGAAGGGIACTGNSAPQVANTILFGDAAPAGPEIDIDDFSLLAIDHCDVEGGRAAARVAADSVLDWGAGMIDADPLFAGAQAGDFHLTWNSPCRDTGSNLLAGIASGLPERDFEGDPRSIAGSADMGADEFYYHLYRLGAAVPGGTIVLKAAGGPGMSVTLALSRGLRDQPLTTPAGGFFLELPLIAVRRLGVIPASGILSAAMTVPPSWSTGGEYALQAFAAGAGPFTSRLTNAMTLEVE